MTIKTDEDPFYKLHIFYCTNQRPDGHPRGSCAGKGAKALRDYMKARAKELGIEGVRVNAAGCLDRCELGPTLVVYPDGTWYRATTPDDVDQILENHCLKGEVVERLRLSNDQTE